MKQNTDTLKKEISLEKGHLELTELWDGKLVLGELKTGKSDERELKRALVNAGYSEGFFENGIKNMAEGYRDQYIVALAEFREEPGRVSYLFEPVHTLATLLKWVRNKKIEITNLNQPVQKNTPLLRLKQLPGAVILYPSGYRAKLSHARLDDLSLLAGDNTKLDETNKMILASGAGIPQKNVFGIVAVYPSKKLRMIGKGHGYLHLEDAAEVQFDVSDQADVESIASITVHGMIRSARLQIEGNLHVMQGISNRAQNPDAHIRAGQSILTEFMDACHIWAGDFIYCRTRIHKSRLECVNTIVAPEILFSEVRVGNRLICHSIDEKSFIYLGKSFVSHPEMKHKYNIHLQHERRLQDLSNTFNSEKNRLLREREKIVVYLKKMKRLSKTVDRTDPILNRLYESYQRGVKKLETLLSEYRETARLFQKESMELAFYERHKQRAPMVELIVTGTLQRGATIKAPSQVWEVPKTMHGVKISMEHSTGLLDIQPMDGDSFPS